MLVHLVMHLVVHLVMHLVMDQCYLLLDKFEFEGILDSLMSTTSGEPGAAARVKGIFLCFYIFHRRGNLGCLCVFVEGTKHL